MKYHDVVNLSKLGYIFMLPKFVGYFKWDFGKDCLIFNNKDYRCKLDIQNRDDFYYII